MSAALDLEQLLGISQSTHSNWEGSSWQSGDPMTTDTNYTNHLNTETSPYLLQHANNPVDWMEWGEEAFAKALAEDKPVFLSIKTKIFLWF